MNASNTPAKAQKQKAFFNPGTIFLILGGLIGLIYCVVIPYGAGFDEETHLVRIYDISGLNFLPNHSKQAKTVTFKEFFDLSYQRRSFQSPAFDLFSADKFGKKLDANNLLPIQTRSIYSPVIFIPQAIIAKILWGAFDFPVIPVVILERIAGLLVYLIGAYLTIRILPLGKWVFMVLALSPMALFQAATLNADGFTSAVSFLFIGLTLKTYAEGDKIIRPWQIGALVGLALLLGLAKPGAVILLPLLLILPYRRFPSKALFAALWAGAILAVLLTVGWTVLAVPKSHFSENGSQDITRQLHLILADPIHFVSAYVNGTIASAGNYFRDWVGVYGYWVGEVPKPIYLIYPFALLAALLSEPRVKGFPWKARLIIFGVFVVSMAAIIFLYQYLHYSPDASTTLGRQGRYFIPLAPLFFLSLAGLVSVREGVEKYARGLAVALLLVVIGFYSFGLYAAYYTDCGYAIYAGRSCVLPVYKNLEKDGAPEVLVNTQSAVSQTFTSDCGKLEAVQILVKSVPDGAKGTLRLSVLDSRGKVLSTKDYQTGSLPLGSYFSLPVTPAADLKNATYEIRLESTDVTPASGIGIAIRPGDQYREGSLMVAGTPYDGHLIFHYACPNPFISR